MYICTNNLDIILCIVIDAMNVSQNSYFIIYLCTNHIQIYRINKTKNI